MSRGVRPMRPGTISLHCRHSPIQETYSIVCDAPTSMRFPQQANRSFLGALTRFGRSRATARQRGQSLTEFALLAPVLITLTLGVADGGRAFYYQEAAVNATRQAIRLAAHDHTYGDYACAN